MDVKGETDNVFLAPLFTKLFLVGDIILKTWQKPNLPSSRMYWLTMRCGQLSLSSTILHEYRCQFSSSKTSRVCFTYLVCFFYTTFGVLSCRVDSEKGVASPNKTDVINENLS